MSKCSQNAYCKQNNCNFSLWTPLLAETTVNKTVQNSAAQGRSKVGPYFYISPQMSEISLQMSYFHTDLERLRIVAVKLYGCFWLKVKLQRSSLRQPGGLVHLACCFGSCVFFVTAPERASKRVELLRT